jgi:hypothetical protein
MSMVSGLLLRLQLSVTDDGFRLVFSTFEVEALLENGCGMKNGAEVAVRKVAGKCLVESEQSSKWNSPPIAGIVDFVAQAFEAAANIISGTAVCHVIARMAASPYLSFPSNLGVLLKFCLRVGPRIHDLSSTPVSERIGSAIRRLHSYPAEALHNQGPQLEVLLATLNYAMRAETVGNRDTGSIEPMAQEALGGR